MFNGDVGGVSGGNNIQWNKKLAEELDAADGKKDGNISASVWNDFMKSTGSSGNRIKNFININNAERSLNFYDKKKDVGKVDWGNWEEMLENFKAKLKGDTPKVDPKPEPTTDPKEQPKVDQTQEPKTAPKVETPTAEEVKAAMKNSPMANVKTPQDLKKLDTSKYPMAADCGPGETRLVNPETGESLVIKEGFGAEGTNGTITYSDGTVTHTINYSTSENGKLQSGEVAVKQPDGSVKTYKYSYDENGEIVPDKTANEPDLRNTMSVQDQINTLKDNGFELKTDKDGVQVYTDKDGYSVAIAKDNDGNTTIECKDNGKLERTTVVDKDGYVTQKSEFREGVDSGRQIEIRRNYFKDGSIQKVAFVDGQQMDDFDDASMPEVGELQFMVKDSPAKLLNSKFPKAEDLLKSGYVLNEMMTTNGGSIYENPKTGETIVLSEFDHSIEYRKGDIRQVQYYDEEGNVSGGRITQSSGNGAFKVYEYNNSNSDKLEVVSSYSKDSPNSNIDLALDAFDGHFAAIENFKKSLGCPENLNFEFPPINTNVENYHGEHPSDDGNYNMKVDVDREGNVQITYAQKQPDGSFKDIGVINLKKEVMKGTLRGYDYRFEGNNLLTGEQNTISSASWEEGNY